jgi:uncharacterized membrane protein
MGSNRTSGIILVLFCMVVYFLIPINDYIGIPKTILGANYPSITLSLAFNLCSNPLIGALAGQCQTVNFASYFVFLLAFIGLIAIVKD